MIRQSSGRPGSAAGRAAVSFLEYAFVFTVVVECNSLFHYSENYRQTTMEIILTLFAIVLAGGLAVLNCRRCRVRMGAELKRIWPVGAALILCVLAFLALNVLRLGAENSLRKYFLSFVCFLPAAYVLLRIYRAMGEPERLLLKYADVVVAAALCSLVVFFAVTLRPELVRAQLIRTRWSAQGYLRTLIGYLDLCCVSPSDTRTLAGFTFYRNMGFFTEPLMFCIPLITALFTEMFLRPKGDRRVWKWIVLLAAVVSTQSTLGMLLATGAVGVKLVEGIRPKKRWIMAFPALIVVALFAFLLLRQKSDVGGGSTAAHIEHYIAAVKTFLEHPLLGCGYLREEPILLHLSKGLQARSKGLSNSVAVVLAEGGILLGLICMLPFFIGLAQLRSRNSRRVALWTLGPLGLYCVTVFHFHLLLMLFMAYGYAMLELAPAEGGRGRRLALAECAADPPAREKPAPGERAAKGAAILAGCCAAGALFLSGGFWQALSCWLRSNQLYFCQSAWKLFFFSLFVILAAVTLRFAVRAWAKKEGPWIAETVWFLLYTALYAAAYPALFSLASTALDIGLPFGDFFETAALAGLYFGGVGAGWLLISLLRARKRLFAPVLAAVLLAAGLWAGACLRASRVEVGAEEIAPTVRAAAAAARGKVYANERQAAMKRALPELSFSAARDGAFTAFENATVVTLRGSCLGDLLDAGFEVTQLSSEYILYSNDPGVIQRLRGEGFAFFKYYPYAMSAESEAAAVLKSGGYTLTAALKTAPAENAPHTPAGSVYITSYYGTKQVLDRAFYADEFDEGGELRLELPFDSEGWEGMEYRVVPEEGFDLRVEELTLTATPRYLTQATYDGRHLLIGEAYYELSGEPYYQPKGYAAFTREYDRAGKLTRCVYYDGNGMPVRIRDGYASYTREFDLHGRLHREAFFDENGELCPRKQGYAAYEREYDRKGNVTVQRYFGKDGLPVTIKSGYAEVRSVYNSGGQPLEQRYYGEKGENILLPKGYWMVKREYDGAGNETVQRFFDTEGQPVITDMGYAEVRRTYNAERQLVLEEYFGVRGEPIALPNGAASLRIDYAADGSESAQHYYDLNGVEFVPEE